MKRLIRAIFVLLTLLILSSCGGSDPTNTSQSADANAQTDATAESASDTSDADTSDADTSETDTADAPDAAVDEPAADSSPATAPDEATVDAEPGEEPAPQAEQVAVLEASPVVYNSDFGTSIAPIFEGKCASCHNAGGPGAVHWQLEDAADLVDTHQWIAGIVGTGYMPPWPASDLSPAFHDNRSLSPSEIAAVAAWSAEGAPLDVEPATPIVATAPLITLDADVVIDPHESYQGSTSVSDDYRCLIYDPQLTETAWMQGYEFIPDQTAVVHHAVGYLVPASEMTRALQISANDEGGGWQCYGGPALQSANLFLGWAPGQQPSIYPAGSGIRMEPGDFLVLQIHYHYDIDAPEDASTLAVDWAESAEGLDPIEFGEYLGPAEIPCSSNEEGPLCDRDNAIALARERFGPEGTLADAINRICGVSPDDFVGMTDGVASSACTIPVRTVGEIVSIFGHQHEIGKSVRMTLNPGRADERILLDIPVWSFDWQLNYEPVESIMLERGDEILLECEWDRALRKPDLEPSYVLWADGTNDEMCFATITTRLVGSGQAAPAEPTADDSVGLPADLVECVEENGVTGLPYPARDQVDAAVEALFECGFANDIGAAYTSLIAQDFGDLMTDDNFTCISTYLSSAQGVREIMISSLPDSTSDERLPIAELVADCVSLAEAIASFGFPIPDDAVDCVNEAGREVLIQATLTGELPDQVAVLGIIGPCLGN